MRNLIAWAGVAAAALALAGCSSPDPEEIDSHQDWLAVEEIVLGSYEDYDGMDFVEVENRGHCADVRLRPGSYSTVVPEEQPGAVQYPPSLLSAFVTYQDGRTVTAQVLPDSEEGRHRIRVACVSPEEVHTPLVALHEAYEGTLTLISTDSAVRHPAWVEWEGR